MHSQYVSLALIVLLGAMSPGPDFAIVAKNSLLHSRRSGIFTSLGVGAAIMVHMSYCVLGLAVLISSSALLFDFIKYAGGAYLIYLGFSSLFTPVKESQLIPEPGKRKTGLSRTASFRQGFFCNLLNPKATLFFLALFTLIINPGTPVLRLMSYALEIFIVTTLWFCSLTVILSHPAVKRWLEKAEKYIVKILGVFLVGFGLALVFIK